MNQNPVARMILSEDIQEFRPVLIGEKNLLLLVASACDVIQRPRILNPNRPTHGSNFNTLWLLCQISRSDTRNSARYAPPAGPTLGDAALPGISCGILLEGTQAPDDYYWQVVIFKSG